jgi:glucose/arabinose dehydrogenase
VGQLIVAAMVLATLVVSLTTVRAADPASPGPPAGERCATAPVSQAPSPQPVVSAGPSPTAAPSLAGRRTTVRQDRPALSLGLEPVPGTFLRPVLVTHAGDERLFVVGQLGTITVVCPGGTVPEPFLDLTHRVSCCGEDGLLGLAFHPDHPINGRFFVTFVDAPTGDTILAEFQVGADPDRADPATERTILRLNKPFPFHWGGGIAFGPDGYLYLGTGDGGHGTGIRAPGDEFDNGQRTDTLLGKILRLDVDPEDATVPYGVPPDNPFVGRPGEDEIWAYGLRNPWRFSIDPATGDLWIGDVGHSRWEEIDVARGERTGRRRVTVGGRGANFGWRILEGDACYEPAVGCDPRGTRRPLYVYGHGSITMPTRSCAVVGGHVYRGAALPALHGSYLFADYCSGRILRLPATARRGTEAQPLLETSLIIASFGQDAAGELYVTDLSGNAVYRLIGAPGS